MTEIVVKNPDARARNSSEISRCKIDRNTRKSKLPLRLFFPKSKTTFASLFFEKQTTLAFSFFKKQNYPCVFSIEKANLPCFPFFEKQTTLASFFSVGLNRFYTRLNTTHYTTFHAFVTHSTQLHQHKINTISGTHYHIK